MSARQSRSDRQPVISNLAARIVALVALAAATIIVARTGGAKAVGVFSLLRVLPWLAGAIASQGVVGAAPYFLSGPTRRDRNADQVDLRGSGGYADLPNDAAYG